MHIRTSNPIESTFSTLRHRTKRVKGAFSKESALSMMLQLSLEAEKRWHRITAVEKLGQLIEGVNGQFQVPAGGHEKSPPLERELLLL